MTLVATGGVPQKRGVSKYGIIYDLIAKGKPFSHLPAARRLGITDESSMQAPNDIHDCVFVAEHISMRSRRAPELALTPCRILKIALEAQKAGKHPSSASSGQEILEKAPAATQVVEDVAPMVPGLTCFEMDADGQVSWRCRQGHELVVSISSTEAHEPLQGDLHASLERSSLGHSEIEEKHVSQRDDGSDVDESGSSEESVSQSKSSSSSDDEAYVHERDIKPSGVMGGNRSHDETRWSYCASAERKRRRVLVKPCMDMEQSAQSVVQTSSQVGISSALTSSLGCQQLEILRDLAKAAWQLDPAKHPAAHTSYQHFVQSVHVSKLCYTHDSVKHTFDTGKHSGEPVHYLATSLLNGSTGLCDLPLLVVVHRQGCHYVVYGNRRPCAVKMYATQVRYPVIVEVFVHDFPFKHLSRDLAEALQAKFTLSFTSKNGGQDIQLR